MHRFAVAVSWLVALPALALAQGASHKPQDLSAMASNR